MLRILAVLLALVAAGAAPARAHGPCLCLHPVLVEPGEGRVTAGTPAFRVILNPRPRELGIAPDALASAYRVASPTLTLLDRSRRKPLRRWSFRVPDVPPGVYLVLIFDGSEGGAHSTWDYLHVAGPAPRGTVAAAVGDGRARPAPALLPVAAAAAVALAAVIARRRARRR